MAQSILFTNLYLGAYTGSELHILKLATEFKKHGWDVTCYTFIAAYPLLERFRDADIEIIEFGSEELLKAEYDVLFAQHHILSDYLLVTQQVAFKKVAVSMLGVKTMHELPPSFARNADLAVFVSEECKDAYTAEFEAFAGTQLVMPNYANDELFDCTQPSYSKLERIAVVSNHVAPELLKLNDVVSGEVELSFYGLDSCAVEVTPELLKQHDLVITIGRTVIDCMALCVPVYCYDIFGGPGYLAPKELDEHAYANYSGRSKPIKHDAESLWADIQKGYAECLTSLPNLRAYAEAHNRFSNLFSLLLEGIGSILDGLAYRNPLAACTQEHREKIVLLAILQHRNIKGLFGTAHCFVRSKSSDEQRSIVVPYRYRTEIELNIDLDDDEFIERFRPDIKPCACRLDEVEATPLNGNVLEEDDLLPIYPGCDSFLHSNPIYRIDEPSSQIRFHVIPYDANRATCELHRIWASSQRDIRTLQAEQTRFTTEIASLKNDVDRQANVLQEKEGLLEHLDGTVKQMEKEAVEREGRIKLHENQIAELKKRIEFEQRERESLWWTVKHIGYLILKKIGVR